MLKTLLKPKESNPVYSELPNKVNEIEILREEPLHFMTKMESQKLDFEQSNLLGSERNPHPIMLEFKDWE